MDNIEADILQAERLLEKARERKATQQQAAYDAAAAALEKSRRSDEEKAALVSATAALVEKQWLERRAKEDAEKAVVLSAERAEKIRLEQEFAKQEEALRLRDEKEERLQKLTEAAFEAEKEAQRLESEAIRLANIKRERDLLLLPAVELPPSQAGTSGLEDSASAMSEAQWGNNFLRNLFNRSAETNSQPSAPPVASAPPQDSAHKRKLIELYSEEAVNDVLSFIRESPITQEGELTTAERMLRSRAL